MTEHKRHFGQRLSGPRHSSIGLTSSARDAYLYCSSYFLSSLGYLSLQSALGRWTSFSCCWMRGASFWGWDSYLGGQVSRHGQDPRLTAQESSSLIAWYRHLTTSDHDQHHSSLISFPGLFPSLELVQKSWSSNRLRRPEWDCFRA